MKTKLLNVLSAVILFLVPNVLFGQAPNLGAAADFALFTAAGAINNTGTTVITGDIGTNVGAFNGFPPGIINGQTHVADAVSAQAASDLALAYGSMSTITCGPVLATTMGSGQLLTPNVYCLGAASTLNGELTLDAQNNPNAIFIFKIDGAFATSTNARVTLINGANYCNIYWQINGMVTLANGTIFKGNILANGAISLLGNASLEGRALSTMGAISTENNAVTLGLRPVASVITSSTGGSTPSFCQGGSIVLSGNIGGTWSTGETTTSITVSTAGDYFITNTSGCRSVISNHIIVTVNPLPAATTGGNVTICNGNSVQLGANPVSGNTYLWTPAAGLSSTTVSNPIASPVATTTYTLTETITATGCQKSNMATVTVGSPATCSISGNTTICQGGSTTLSVPAGAVNYEWSTGAIGPLVNSIIVNAAGRYSVTVTVTAGPMGCTNMCSIDVTVQPQPTPSVITGLTSFCAGGSVVLSGNVGGTWQPGGQTTPSITVTAAGDYFVTNTNSCGSINSNHIVVTVNPLPSNIITGANAVCQGEMTTICAPPSTIANPLTYLWSTGATTDCISAGAGAYSVVIRNANGCISIGSKVIIVNPLPAATTGGNVTICSGNSVQLGANPVSGNTYLWTPAAGLSSTTVSNPIASPVATTTYTLTETITATGCQKSNMATVTVGSPATCSISGNTTICQGGSTTLSVPAGAVNYEWSTGAIGPLVNSIIVNAAGRYSVTVTVTAGPMGCTNMCSIDVTVQPQPTPSVITGLTSFCAGGSVVLSGNVGGTWQPGGQTTPSITVTAAGDYFVTNTNSCGSINSNHIVVTVNPLPSNIITGANAVCQGEMTTICAPPSTIANPLTYLWSTGATTDCISAGAGAYSVVIRNANGCFNTGSKVIIANPLPNATTGSNLGICDGNSVTIGAAPVAGSTYLWTPSTGLDDATKFNPMANPSITTTYTLTETITATGCKKSNAVTVTVGFVPITGLDQICPGKSTELCAPEGFASYMWNTGATTRCITVSSAGLYFVSVSGCSSPLAKRVTVIVPRYCDCKCE